MPVTRVLYRADNPADLDRLVAHPAVDAVALDARVRGAAVLASKGRWPRLAGRIPWRGEASAPLDALLASVIDATAGDTAIVVNLRADGGDRGDPAVALARVLAPLGAGAHLRVTCEAWEIADRVRGWLPEIEVAYAIRTERQLLQYLEARDRGLLRPTPVIVQHALLHTPDEVESIRRHAGRVGARTIDDIDRAIELAEWGVDEVWSRHVVVLNSL